MDFSAFDLDQRARLSAFAFPAQQIQGTLDRVLSPLLLATDFPFDLPIANAQGTFWPSRWTGADMPPGDLAMSIRLSLDQAQPTRGRRSMDCEEYHG